MANHVGCAEMNKIKRLDGLVLLALSLCACSSTSSSMNIAPAELNDDEKQILQLIGEDKKDRVYDFSLDENVKQAVFQLYELVGDEWQLLSSDAMDFQATNGRFALEFDILGEDLRIALQDQNGVQSSSSTPSDEFANTSMSKTLSTLGQAQEIVYYQEIQLAIQILTNKNNIHSYIVDKFFQPQLYAEYDYEYVYALTVTFSTKPLGEQ